MPLFVHSGSAATGARTSQFTHTRFAGNMYKVKLGSDGALHLHTESKPRPDTTLAISVKMDALKPSGDPQIGFSVDHAP